VRCAQCDGEFTPKNSRRRFCSAKCRKAAWTDRREQELALVLESLTRATEHLRGIHRPKGAPGAG
jgi:hypothetical protein